MGAPEQPRVSVCISLDTQSYAFIHRFIAAGVFDSPDAMIAAALQALADAIEASAWRAVLERGCPNAEPASLEVLADMLHGGRSRQTMN